MPADHPDLEKRRWDAADELQPNVQAKYCLLPNGKATLACVQHFIHHLSPSRFAGVALVNGYESRN